MKKQVCKSLGAVLCDGDVFYIGITKEDFNQCLNLKRFGLKKEFSVGEKQIPIGGGPISRFNIDGKDQAIVSVKQKVTKRVEYLRKNDSKYVSYDRTYEIYEKQNISFKISFQLKENLEGQLFVISPLLEFNHHSTARINHVVQLFNEIFGQHNIYDEQLKPLIKISDVFDFEILPSGMGAGKSLNNIVSLAERVLKKNELRNLKERLNVIFQFEPKVVGMGSEGFNGYLVFEIEKFNVAILESMRHGNATYVFSRQEYKELMTKDKQELIARKLFKKRIFHNVGWEPALINCINQ